MESYPADWYHRLPAPVKEIFTVLRRHGHITYIVGGAVRDFLLELEPKDFDLVTNAKPDEIAGYFPKTVDVGRAFGIMIVVQDGLAIEVASFRKDGEYRDGRHPEKIEFAGPEEDAKRRDFTVNGLFWDPETKTVIDYVNGKKDIDDRILRAIGDADLRFGEDALRMLRAIRLHAQLPGFHLDPGLLQAIEKRRNDLRHVSNERITAELNHILKSRKPSIAFQSMDKTGLTQLLLPELENLPALALDKLGTAENLGLYWALLLLFVVAENRKKFVSRFVLSREQKDCALTAADLFERLNGYNGYSMAEKKGLLNSKFVSEAITLLKVLEKNTQAIFNDFNHWKNENKLNPPPLLNGKDLLALGATPGPEISKILAAVRIAQLNEKIHSREEALEIFSKMKL